MRGVATFRDGRVVNVRSAYLIGADGARSMVRDAIGATMTGEGAFSRNYSIIFRAPELAARQMHEPAIMYWMLNEEVPSILGPMDESGLWFFMVAKLDVDPATLDAVDLIRRGTGLTDLAVEIVDTDLWVAHRLVADRYSRGRVFLAGDACHLHPPFGGFGMNMGVGDAVDLGWKMAARLAGWGGDTLLASYEAERHKVHERTIAEAVHNYSAVSNEWSARRSTSRACAARRRAGRSPTSSRRPRCGVQDAGAHPWPALRGLADHCRRRQHSAAGSLHALCAIGASGLPGAASVAVRRSVASRSFRPWFTLLVTDADAQPAHSSAGPRQSARCR